MTVVSTANQRISNLLKAEDSPSRSSGLTRQEVVFNFASEVTLTLGSVLGVITANGKYAPADPAAIDGTADAVAVFLMGPDALGSLESTSVTIPAATDTTIIVLAPKTGAYAVVAEQGLVFDVAHDAGQTATAIASLSSVGIQTQTQA